MESNNTLKNEQLNEECEESLKGPSFTLMYVLLVALFSFIFISMFSLNQLKQIEKEKANQITEIKNALANLETLPDQLYTAEGEKKNLTITIERPHILMDQEEYLGTVIPIIQEQNSQAYDKLSSNLTLFSIIIALFSLALPIFSYTFIQRDQLRSINAQHYRLKKDAEQRFKELENKNNALENALMKKVDDAVNLLRKEIKQAQEVASGVIPNPKARDAIEITPTSEAPADTARALFLSARINLSKKNYEEALQQIDQAIKLEPNNTEYQYIKSLILFNSGNFAETLLSDNRMLELEPNNAKNYDSRAATLARLKRYEEAQADNEQAMLIDSGNKRYIANVSYRLYQRGLYSKALESCAKMGKFVDEFYTSLRTRAMATLKQAILDVGSISEEQRKQALNDMVQALKIDPDNKYSYIDQAQAFFLLREYDSMHESLEKALSLDANEPETYHWLAEYYRAIDDKDNAEFNDRLADENGYIPEPNE